jgi:hypothetical protein
VSHELVSPFHHQLVGGDERAAHRDAELIGIGVRNASADQPNEGRRAGTGDARKAVEEDVLVETRLTVDVKQPLHSALTRRTGVGCVARVVEDKAVEGEVPFERADVGRRLVVVANGDDVVEWDGGVSRDFTDAADSEGHGFMVAPKAGFVKWCAPQELNPQPSVPKTEALPVELGVQSGAPKRILTAARNRPWARWVTDA